MSEQPETAAFDPEWDRGDRMRKALRIAGMTPGEMAIYLQVGREPCRQGADAQRPVTYHALDNRVTVIP